MYVVWSLSSSHVAWPVLGAGVALGLAAGAVSNARHKSFTRHQPTFVLTTPGIEADGLLVPWVAVTRALTASGRGPAHASGDGRSARPRDRTWRFLAVEVDDVREIEGPTDFRAALSDARGVRTVLLAEMGELRDPAGVFAALERLVAEPAVRESLATPDAGRLFVAGP